MILRGEISFNGGARARVYERIQVTAAFCRASFRRVRARKSQLKLY